MYPGTALRKGDPRTDLVKLCQNRLNIILCDDLKVDGDFGAKTEASVKLFQTRRSLKPDGVLGPVSWAELFGRETDIARTPETPLLAGALQAALSQVGVREIGGRNRGPQVDQYLAAVGTPPGLSWCMAFCCWAFKDGANSRHVENPVVMTAGVHRHWRQAPDEIKVASDAALDDLRNIKPGMIYLIDHGFGKGHCGLVVTAEPDGIHGVEGNTNERGSREGDGVYRKIRSYSEILLGYLDYGRL